MNDSLALAFVIGGLAALVIAMMFVNTRSKP